MRKLSISALAVAIAACGSALGPAQAMDGRSEIERVCAPQPDRTAHEGKFAEFLTERLKLSDAQQASFKAFQQAREKALETSTTRLCAKKPDVTSFEGRLLFHQAFLEDRLEAVRAENPKLIEFYNSLDADQKAKFDKIRDHMAGRDHR
jgi:hypothetical protein